MNESSIFIWLKSIKTRLEKYGAATATMGTDAGGTPEWTVSYAVHPADAGYAVTGRFSAGSFLELMDVGNKCVDSFDLEKERTKTLKILDSQMRITSTSSGSGGAAYSTTTYSGLFGERSR